MQNNRINEKVSCGRLFSLSGLANVCVICYFWSRTATDGASASVADITKYFNGVFDANGNLTQFEITADTHPTYIRLNTGYIGPDSILTIDEPIE